ncbi:O-antigen ligase family protein [Vibrio breoganii]|uniref:O-antigen ligase family protein n=1 Tax=Vibrio breoganii TaxID=553239 RepID=UPI0021C30636|nr:O-antigen ligase family protein [Vibrio breoganii]MDN3714571.1 O-antigen ligase family protein [Vibrio breoganii]
MISNSKLSMLKITAATSAMYPVISVFIGSGYNYGAVLAFIPALFACIANRGSININRETRNFILILLAYFFSFVITVVYTGNSISDLDRPSRAILAIPVLLSLVIYPPKIKYIAISIFLGSLAAGAIGLYYFIYFPDIRAFDAAVGGWWLDGYMQIQTGAMVTTLAMSCLALSIYYYRRNNFKLVFISIISFLLAIFGSAMSGSRGVWIFIPIAIIYLFYINRDLLNKKIFAFIIIVLSLIFNALVQTKLIQERLDLGINNIQDYSEGINTYTSFGIRMDLWKSAIVTFNDHPILGAGTEERIESRKLQGESGLINIRTSKLRYHAHNQFLENLSVYGIVGLITLLLLFLYPLYFFTKKSDKNDSIINQLGFIHIIMMMGYCLSQSVFNHNSGIIYYCLMLVILASPLLNASHTTGKEND